MIMVMHDGICRNYYYDFTSHILARVEICLLKAMQCMMKMNGRYVMLCDVVVVMFCHRRQLKCTPRQEGTSGNLCPPHCGPGRVSRLLTCYMRRDRSRNISKETFKDLIRGLPGWT